MNRHARVLLAIAGFVVVASCDGSPCAYCPAPLVYSRPLTDAERVATDTPPSREQCEMLCDEWGPHFFSGDANRLDGGMSAVDAGYPLRVYHWLCDVEAGTVTCSGFPPCDN